MHIIRLRGPWQLEAEERLVRAGDGRYEHSAEALPEAARATMPADWSNSFGEGFLGRVRYRRTFQKPTGLDGGERVWLVVEPPRSYGIVELNSKRLGETSWGGGAYRCPITELLQDHNHLEIIVVHPALDEASVAEDDSNTRSPGGLVGEVRLEIEE